MASSSILLLIVSVVICETLAEYTQMSVYNLPYNGAQCQNYIPSLLEWHTVGVCASKRIESCNATSVIISYYRDDACTDLENTQVVERDNCVDGTHYTCVQERPALSDILTSRGGYFATYVNSTTCAGSPVAVSSYLIRDSCQVDRDGSLGWKECAPQGVIIYVDCAAGCTGCTPVQTIAKDTCLSNAAGESDIAVCQPDPTGTTNADRSDSNVIVNTYLLPAIATLFGLSFV